MTTFILLSLLALSALALASDESTPNATAKTNIVFILADDMGYGDVQSQNPHSQIPTPHLDQLAAEGLRFNDAHSGSAVCTPTRYGLLTGRYCWRSRLKTGVLGGYSSPLIADTRRTVATMLQDKGYATAMVGKWHLGMNMARRNNQAPAQDRWDGDGNVDFSKQIADSPITRGFDAFFGVSASLDMAPFVFIHDDRFSNLPTIQHPPTQFPLFARKGPQAPDFEFENVLNTLADKSIAYIEDLAQGNQPFFLYLALTGPHKPIAPHPRWVGKSKLGPYGDFVMNVDDIVGRVLDAIDRVGIRDETLMIYSSDNGSYMYHYDDAKQADHVDDVSIQGYRSEHHTPNGALRGTKADVWEAGHRVPFLVRWPGHIRAGTSCDETICLTDFFATAADIVGMELRHDEAEDSFSLLPLFTAQEGAKRGGPVINHSAGGMFAIRDGKWKLVAGNGSGGRETPRGKPFGRPYQLYDLAADIAERHDVIGEHAELARRLETQLELIRERGRSRD